MGLNLGFVLFVCMQVRQLSSVVQPTAGDFVLSLLPPWHMYERSAEYFILSHGVTQVYTNIKHMKVDCLSFSYVVGYCSLCLSLSLSRILCISPMSNFNRKWAICCF